MAIEIDALSVSYGAVPALRGVSFTAPAGEITAVLGANGAGKTTLLRAMTGLVRPSGGHVRFDGLDLTTLRVEDVVRRGVAHVPEGRGVITELTVDENLRLGALWRRRQGDYKSAIDAVYDLFPPLAARRRRPSATLSGGERQMLAIGRALAARPKVLLLDEPSLGLAPMVTAELMAVIRDLTSREQLTVILVEQNARSALSIATTAVVMNLGQIVVSASAASLAGDEHLRHHYLGF